MEICTKMSYTLYCIILIVCVTCAVDLFVSKVSSNDDLVKLLTELNRVNAGTKKHCPFDHLDPIFQHLRGHARDHNVILHTPCLNARSMGMSSLLSLWIIVDIAY